MSNPIVELADTQQRLRNTRVVDVEAMPPFTAVTIKAEPPLGYSSGERLLELLGKNVQFWDDDRKFTGRIIEVESGLKLTAKLSHWYVTLPALNVK